MVEKRIYGLTIIAFVSGCTAIGAIQLQNRFGEAEPRERVVETLSPQMIDYWSAVKPIIDNRCVVCHACTDAQCQLKMSSIEGIERGASADKVYQPARLTQAPMTRLFQDAHSTSKWREMGFSPVLNEFADTPEANREAGVLYQILQLKLDNPLPNAQQLPDSFDLSLDRNQVCAKPETFDRYADAHPLWGMPYALPAMPALEQGVLMNWIVQGATYLPRAPLDPIYQSTIDRWEQFLNGGSLKEQLTNRYIFEHLFVAHLYFSEIDQVKFFQLVRSATPPGEPVELIATRRPYNDPEVPRVYYRIVEVLETIVAKTHMPYRLDDERMRRWQSLFIDEQYDVTGLPSYEESLASNPFLTFRDLPVRSRYKFMLDEAQFTIMGFIKGPVCRGSVALDIINDRFWVFFVNPDEPAIDEAAEFYATNAELLDLPASSENIYNPLGHWRRFAAHEKAFLEEWDQFLSGLPSGEKLVDLELVWDGDGVNGNSALTIFRHFDSATVKQGLLGQPPKTAWLIGYSLLERIHYLLVAGYDLYGNFGHQVVTRLYMDFMRMEGEANFLLMLPESARNRERNFWYRGAEQEALDHMTLPVFEDQSIPNIPYETDDEKLELFGMLEKRLEAVLPSEHTMAAIPDTRIRNELDRLNRLVGTPASLMPETAFVRVQAAAGDQYVTLVRNDAHLNITSMFGERKERIPAEDTVSVIPGFIGGYPNVFYVVAESELTAFVNAISNLQTEADYSRLLDAYGIRRTNPEFWSNSDTFHLAYRQQYPLESGVLDYNRLENR